MATTTTKPKPLGLDLRVERDRSYGIDPDAARISRIPTGSIRPDPDQPRKSFDPAALQELADSLVSAGQIHPIHVRSDPDAYDRYLLIAGERRWRAAQIARLPLIDCIVKDAERAAEIQLIENLQREDLRPLEEAFAFKRYMDERGLTQAAMAKVVGKRQSTISEILSLTTLPEPILEALPDHPDIPKSQLVLIAKEREPERQRRMWEEALGGTLTVQRGRAIADGRAGKGRAAGGRRATADAARALARSIESDARRLAALDGVSPAQLASLRSAIDALGAALEAKRAG